MSQSLIITQSAAAKVYELIREENNLNLKLRVYIEGGGCSGFKYSFAFQEEPHDDDHIVEKQLNLAGEIVKVQVLVDMLSHQYLAGAEIDYKEDIEGERFIIRNPNAATTCGCGSSFTVD